MHHAAVSMVVVWPVAAQGSYRGAQKHSLKSEPCVTTLIKRIIPVSANWWASEVSVAVVSCAWWIAVLVIAATLCASFLAFLL